MSPLVIIVFVAASSLLLLTVAAASHSWVIARPDEWLLCIRNGALARAGVGISLWRRPGDVVARFTSTVQRVAFSVDALSAGRAGVTIDGFILWSVSPDGDGPFRAFRKLGLVNLDRPPAELRSAKHLLSTPQHRAFRQLLSAGVQRRAASATLDQLLLRQDLLLDGLGHEWSALETDLGIVIDQIEIVRVRPTDPEMLRQLAAETEEQLAEQAAQIRAQASERAKLRAIESEARIAEEAAIARRRELERDKELRLSALAQEEQVRQREEAAERDRALAEEERRMVVTEATIARQRIELAARLEETVHQAEAQRDAIAAISSAEEQKSQAVRDHELSRLVAEKVSDALAQLPLHEARWISVGDSPAATLTSLFTMARDHFAGEGDRHH